MPQLKLSDINSFELLIEYIRREANCNYERAEDIAYELYDDLDRMIQRRMNDDSED